jgi:hypothetical protein
MFVNSKFSLIYLTNSLLAIMFILIFFNFSIILINIFIFLKLKSVRIIVALKNFF